MYTSQTETVSTGTLAQTLLSRKLENRPYCWPIAVLFSINDDHSNVSNFKQEALSVYRLITTEYATKLHRIHQ